MTKLLLAIVLLANVLSVCHAKVQNGGYQPKVEVVFCLDTTGSMGGLIEGAKQKIWSIANQITQGKPTPKLSIGLVGYRDKGDEYVTKVVNFSDDLDAVYEKLTAFTAGGGGDTPEHVNKALYDAVNEIKWSNDSKTLKLVFLVGDCPPHTDYNDGYDYHNICSQAVKNDIIINTVQCGNAADTAKIWKEIAALSEGKYAAVEQNGGMVSIETPMDKDLAKLNSEFEGTIVRFGSEKKQAALASRSDAMKSMAPAIASERALYKAKSGDLIESDLVGHTEVLSNISDKELPEQMRGMSLEERKTFLTKKEAERNELKAKIDKIGKDRLDYIANMKKPSGTSDSFDSIVHEFIKKQALKKGISY